MGCVSAIRTYSYQRKPTKSSTAGGLREASSTIRTADLLRNGKSGRDRTSDAATDNALC